MQDFVKEKIKITAQKLSELSAFKRTTLDGFYILPTTYKKEGVCPSVDETWKELNYGDIIEGIDTHFWIRKIIKTPKRQNEYEKVYFDMDLWYDAQWLVYIDGKMHQNLDGFHRDTELEFDREYDLAIYMYANSRFGENKDGKIKFKPGIKRVDSRIEQLYYDINVPYLSLECLKEDDDNAVITKKYLELACNMLDLRVPYSDNFYKSVDKAAAFLKTEYYEKVCGRSTSTVSCIGHSHIDVAWKWNLAQTEEKVQRTFSTALRLMEEFDDYVFTASQIPLFKFAKRYAPELYQRVKQRIIEGRFQPEGAMYVEADCNLSSGESLVRQIMFGKKFYKDEFDIDSRILWLPDVFGYSSALPQILKKSGIDRFVTSKISWNETNKLPYDVFFWQGLDGSEIFTTFITAQTYNIEKENIHTDYNGEMTPKMVMGARKRFQQKEYSENGGFMTFGYGDGGGGAPRWMMENYKRLKYGLPGLPKARIEGIDKYLDRLYADFCNSSAELKKLPKWVGELYLEFHRGTYTSVARNKKNNRKSEFLMQTAEQLSVMGDKMLGKEYPQTEINDAWELVLLNQFHDIIPGSSIKEVYEDSDKHYAEIKAKGDKICGSVIETLSKGIDKSKGFAIYNPNSFETSGYVEFDGKCGYIENIPSMGWSTAKPDFTNTISVSDNCIENKFYVITFDENANITSIYDKEFDREVIKEGTKANQLEAFEDLPYQYDNWELSEYYKQKKWNVDDLQSIEKITDGARSGFKIIRKFLNSVIEQKVWVYENSRRIDFETDIDWKESHIVLKAAFPINVHADKASYETQFGYVERPTHGNTSWDAARFEVCGHKYADISEDNYGAAILNDCKYGYNAEGGILKLTLLKCGTFPYEEADKEHHSFTYSFMPHSGNHKTGGVIQEAYKLNRPLCAVKAQGDGSITDNFSLVKCDKENVIIETVKKTENSNATVIRAYDAYNRSTKAEITFGFDVKKAYLCDLLENKLEELKVEDNKIKLDIGAFEIVTVMTE